MRQLITVCTFLLFTVSFAAYAQETVKLPREDGNMATLMLYGDWSKEACLDTLVLSHGFGGNEKGLSYIAEAFVKKGYRVAVMGHTVLNEKRDLFKVIFGTAKVVEMIDHEKMQHRFLDLETTLNLVYKDCRPRFVFLAGHSLGATTTIVEAGAVSRIFSEGLDRFDAYIALSQQGEGTLFEKGAWKKVKKPVLFITGTKDKTPYGDYTLRLNAFDGLPAGKKRMAVITGVNHMNLAGWRAESYKATIIGLMDEFLNQVKAKKFSPSIYASEKVKISEK